jgi:hypothetical protein
MKILVNIIVLVMITTYILLAVQAEPVTATLGYVFAGLLLMALIRQTRTSGKDHEDA